MQSHDILNVLLVEDNEGDVLLTKRVFKKLEFPTCLTVAYDGEQAIHVLHGNDPKNPDAALPDLILLDINLPRKDGKEVLKEVKTNNDFKHIPVIMLTSSSADNDIEESYKLHANSYIVKPIGTDKYLTIAKAIEDFWFRTAILRRKD